MSLGEILTLKRSYKFVLSQWELPLSGLLIKLIPTPTTNALWSFVASIRIPEIFLFLKNISFGHLKFIL